MSKFVVALLLGTRSVTNKVEFGRHVVTSMTGNTNFTTPDPALADITTATDDLETAYDVAQGSGALAFSLMREQEAAWDELMTALGKYVDNIARGSESIILSAGMPTKKLSTPTAVPARVVDVKATSVNSGELTIKWKPVRGARAYVGWVLEDEGAKSSPVIKVTRARAIVKGLTSGTRYNVYIEAIGAGGVGPLSDIATSIVL
jgi:hypothetical protein